MKKLVYLFSFCLILGFDTMEAQTCSPYFTFSVNGLTVSFSDTSFATGGVGSRTWDFGDSTTSNATNPSHTYAQGGTYLVCLTVSNIMRTCTTTYCDTVVVSGTSSPCASNFSFTDSIVDASCNNLNGSIHIHNLSGGTSPYTYNWSSGSFGSSNSQLAAGWYTVTITDANGCDTVTAYSIMNGPGTTSFSYILDTNNTVLFTDASQISGATYLWDFGDSSTSTAMNPNHTYSSSGIYYVCLTTTDSNRVSCTYCDSVAVSFTNPTTCLASYSVVKDTSSSFGVLLLNNSSNLSSHKYSWDFGDGSTSNLRNPSHQYSSFGVYNVCLTITDSTNNCSTTFCDSVGMDSLGNLKAGFGLKVQDATTVGLREVENLGSIDVFPNPVSKNLTVDLRAVNEVVNITIMDVTGKVVVQKLNTVPNQLHHMDVSQLNNGFYFIVFDSGTKRTVQKFIKNN